MRKGFLLLILFFPLLIFSQQKKINLEWEGYRTISVGNYTTKVPSFKGNGFSYTFEDGLQFITQWDIFNYVNESSVAVSNVSYSTISENNLLGLDKEQIPNELKFVLKNTDARGKKHAYFEISPIIKDQNGGFKKLTSFTINYSDRSNRSLNRNNKASRVITNSVLSSGEWYRFYVDTTGVFRITKSFLNQLGINTNSINPRNIRLFGNGGRMIPYDNSVNYPFDVTENAIKVIGEEDGRFDDQDYILFYAEGPKEYDADSNTNINCYTDKTYYFINIGFENGKRIQPFFQPTGNVDLMIDTFQDYQFHEVDEYNLADVGRRWFGERFDIENDQNFEFEFPDLITSEPVSMRIYAAATGETSTMMDVNVNNTPITTLTFSGASEPIIAREDFFIGPINVNSPSISVNLNFNNGGNPSAVAYLDYISLEATRALNFNGRQFRFKNYETARGSGIGQYNITNASGIDEIWDVTDLYNVTNFVNSDSNNSMSFTSNLGTLRTYVIVTASDFFEPKMDSNRTIRNQDIKGTIFLDNQGQFQDIDYLIVAPNNMSSQAERLAQINRNQYKLNVKVATLDEIYNEFSSGNQDIGAIRNLVKYIYDNASSPEKKIKYLCLFGDGSFDYKDRVRNNTNIVPSWHAKESFSLTNSFISDDFYGMMGDDEGTMVNSDELDIAVGRILADTPQRANDLIDKIESYYSDASYGSWRNNFIVVSDDVDQDWEWIIQSTTDSIGNVVAREKPFVNVTKIHADSFEQEVSAGGERYPKASEAFMNAMETGALVVNYFGHGGEDGLMQERILEIPDAQDLRNVCKLNCFVTVTCEFTKFDNPFRATAGEYIYWNKEGGAIGLITTTRQIFVSTGITFNNVLEKYLFSFDDTDDYQDYEYPSMAEALRLTKTDTQIVGQSQKRLIFFIGDPAMKLTFPKPNIRLTKVNDIPIGQAIDTLKALSHIKLSGEVTDVSGNLLSNYNGTLSTTIYDKPIDRQTLANDGTSVCLEEIENPDGERICIRREIIKLDFTTLGEIIFRGQASITNGQFEFDFVVPRDIGIPVGYGRISFYAKTENPIQDQNGVTLNTVQIGGINENAAEDNIGPTIRLYMNDENFVSGGITNESPSLLAKLEDENGINTSSGIGHDIVAIIDNDETNPFVLNDYYQTEVDDYQKGIVNYPLRDLEPGLHTLTLKVWDVYNNSSTAEIQFIVHDENQELVINNVLNYPNPFVNYTEFWFNHNSSEPLDVSIQIFTVSGKLVRTLNGQTNAEACCNSGASSLSRNIAWDGRDDFGDKIGKGVYIYKLTVRSNILNKKVEKIEKLVIL